MATEKNGKQTFLLYKDRKALVDACTTEQAGQIFKGIYNYVCDGDLPEFDNPLLKGIFEMFRLSIDQSEEKWDAKRKKAAEAVRRRWGRKEAEDEQEPEPEKPQDDAAADPEPEPAPEPEPEKQENTPKREKTTPEPVTSAGSEQKPTAFSPHRTTARTIFNACLKAYPISPELQATMENWLKYKTERRESYKEQGLRALMKKAASSEQEHGTEAVIAVIEESMANRYQGITWDRISKAGNRASPAPKKQNQFNQFQQNDYDFDALEKELLSG